MQETRDSVKKVKAFSVLTLDRMSSKIRSIDYIERNKLDPSLQRYDSYGEVKNHILILKFLQISQTRLFIATILLESNLLRKFDLV